MVPPKPWLLPDTVSCPDGCLAPDIEYLLIPPKTAGDSKLKIHLRQRIQQKSRLVAELPNYGEIYFLGSAQLARPKTGVGVVAILATYNESRFIDACLAHLVSQGVTVYLLDNESTDNTVSIAEKWLGRGLIGIERLPRYGTFQLRTQLQRKQALALELKADWFIHVDADEILESPIGDLTLAEALAAVDEAGYNAVNFQEFTFIPTVESPDHDHPEYQRTMHHYYPFARILPNGIRAWKNGPEPVNLVASGGHCASIPEMRLCPVFFVMKHYQFLSVKHAIHRYARLNYDPKELDSGMHGGYTGWRNTLSEQLFGLPHAGDLRAIDCDRALDASEPRRTHYLETSTPLSRSASILKHTFCVVVPTYNRAHLLSRALDSLLNQTYRRWQCWIIDDGSTDDSSQVIRHYVDLDKRFHSIRFPENRGGVAANELGMQIACSKTSWWTRLGSDDFFLPHKLELDAQALRLHSATFGPFMVEALNGEPEVVRNLPITARQARHQLETPGGFAASWANVAARTEALDAVKQQFGSYVSPHLHNMEDLLFNFRLSRVADWVWRGRIEGELVIAPSAEVCKAHPAAEGIEHDSSWTRNPVGATANTVQTRDDAELSYGIIAAERHSLGWSVQRPRSMHTPAADGLGEVDARRLIGKLLWSRATCNWKVAEHGDRLGQIWEIGRDTASLAGSVAELGVARGGITRLLSAMFPHKNVYAIDGFTGLVDTDPKFDLLPAKTFADIEVETTREALRECKNVILYHGIFPAVIDARLSNDRFSLVHLDTDTYQSIRAGLRFFVPRLVRGGMIFIDDYGWDKAPGVQRAVDEMLPEWPDLSLCRTTPVQALLQAGSTLRESI